MDPWGTLSYDNTICALEWMVNNMDKYNIRLNLISDRVLMKVLLSYKLNPVDFSLGTFVSLTISFSHM
jgi:hypothetical protein